MADNDRKNKGPSNEDIENQKDFLKISKEIERNERSALSTIKQIYEARARVQQLEQQIEKLKSSGNEEDQKAAKMLEKTLEQKRELLKQHEDALKQISLLRKGVTEPLGRGIDKLGSSIKTGVVDQLRSLPQFLLETTKEVKNAEIRMGKLSNQSEAFTQNLTNAAMETTKIGSNIGEMAQLQADYNARIGRSVSLTEEGHEAMAELVHGTVLGKEGSAELTAQMELFGHTVKDTRDTMNELIDETGSLNISTEKTTENFKQGAQLAQRFRFEEGKDDIKEMAKQATKFRMEMETVAPMAEKVFNVEGAVEMAANLQVMGGEAAKIADPFKLMFEARHDMAAFQDSVVNLTKDMATFNKETGEFELQGLQLHRIREIADTTGIAVDELTKMSRQAAKFEKAEMQMPVGLDFGGEEDEVKEFIKNSVRFNEKGDAKITFTNENMEKQTKLVRELERQDIRQIRRLTKQEQTAKQIAEQATTFDTAIERLLNMAKSVLAPAFKGFTDVVTGGIQNFHDALKDEGKELSKTMKSWGKWAGNLTKALFNFVRENPWKTVAASILGKMAQWFARGMALGRGFLTQTKGMMGGPGGRGASMATGGRGAASRARGRTPKSAFRAAGRQMKGGGVVSGLKSGARGVGRGITRVGMGGGAAGLLGMLAGSGVNALGRNLAEKDVIDSGGKTAFDAVGTGLQGAALGATVGSMIAPGIGTAIGAGIGGAGGALYGGLSSRAPKDPTRKTVLSPSERKMDDFVMRPGEGAVPFNENDTLLGMKEDGPIQSTFDKDDKGGGEMSVRFQDTLEVRGNISITSEDGKPLDNIDFDNHPQLKKKITRMVNEELERNINNGKLQPNP